MLELIVLILLHAPDGNQIAVNPALVTTVREAREVGKLTTDHANCILTMADGKFVSVREECDEVRKLILRGQ